MNEEDPKDTGRPSNPRAGSDSRPDSAGRRRRTRSLVILALLLVGVALVIRGCSGSKPAAFQPPPVPVSTGAVRVGNIDLFLDALGTVTPVTTVTVGSRVTGQLTEVDFQEGQMVKKDDLLAVIDPRPYQALLLQAQGQLARDEALLRNAKIDLARYGNAFLQHAVPEQQVATQQALVDQYAGAVKLDQGNLDAAQVNVDYTRIVSPIDGRVGLRGVDPGNIITANAATGLATVAQLQPITVIFTIAEDDIGAVARQATGGAKLPVYAYDRTDEKRIAAGTLATLDNEINPATGTVRARAVFPNSGNELFPNQFVNARLLVRTISGVNLAPSAAIQRNGEQAYVYVVQPGGTVKLQNVTVTATEADVCAVTGVEAGSQVVTDGFDKLQNGARINVRAPKAGAPAAPKA